MVSHQPLFAPIPEKASDYCWPFFAPEEGFFSFQDWGPYPPDPLGRFAPSFFISRRKRDSLPNSPRKPLQAGGECIGGAFHYHLRAFLGKVGF